MSRDPNLLWIVKVLGEPYRIENETSKRTFPLEGINQSIAPISPSRPGSEAGQLNQCPMTKF